jgi:pimeloyl-ACP methyl ester carboxylesterase
MVNGHSVYYGTGSGSATQDAPVVVFIHGAGFEHSVWVMPARFFARHGFRVVALDLPAHGRSEGEALTSIEAMALWVVELLRTLEIEQAAVVGHSMGSLVAMTLAALHPQYVKKLVLLGTSAPMPVTNLLLDAAQDNHHAAIDMANAWSHSNRGARGASDNPGMSNLNSGERLLERSDAGVFYADLSACNGFASQTLSAASLRGDLLRGDLLRGDSLGGDSPESGMSGRTFPPTLVITGAEDRMTPSKAGLMVAERLPEAQTCVLPGCGHAMLSEQPNGVLDALAGFLLNE